MTINIIKLATQAAPELGEPHGDMVAVLERFAALIIKARDEELLGTGVEPVAVFYRCVLCSAAYEDEPVSECDCATKATAFTRHEYHTADQLAAAVLRERERLESDAKRWTTLSDMVDDGSASVVFMGILDTINTGLEVNSSGDLHDQIEDAIRKGEPT